MSKYINEKEYLSDKIKKVNLINAKKEIEENPILYKKHLAMARLSFRERITVYKLNNEIIQELQNTIIENMPIKTPKIFEKPFLIETIDERNVLFGDIISICGYFSPVKDNDLIKAFKENPDQLPDKIREELSCIVTRDGNDMIFTIIIQTKSYDNNENWQKAALNLNNVSENKKKEDTFCFCGYNIFYIIPNIKKKLIGFSIELTIKEIFL